MVGEDINSNAHIIDTPSSSTPVLPEYDEEENSGERKKRYAVSTVDSLRIRATANTAGAVVGYLDKNDAVIFTEKVGNFYKTIYKETYDYEKRKYHKYI